MFANITMAIQIPESIQPIFTFFHPTVMTATLLLSFYALYLGIQSWRTRLAKGETKKKLLEGNFANRHFQIGSLFLVVMVLGAVGGMAVTYVNNNKLFVGPHLLAGLGLISLVALSAALVPFMQQGKSWARYTHVTINFALVGIFTWQAITGFEIVQRILDNMTKAS
jgi:MFS family permease